MTSFNRDTSFKIRIPLLGLVTVASAMVVATEHETQTPTTQISTYLARQVATAAGDVIDSVVAGTGIEGENMDSPQSSTAKIAAAIPISNNSPAFHGRMNGNSEETGHLDDASTEASTNKVLEARQTLTTLEIIPISIEPSDKPSTLTTLEIIPIPDTSSSSSTVLTTLEIIPITSTSTVLTTLEIIPVTSTSTVLTTLKIIPIPDDVSTTFRRNPPGEPVATLPIVTVTQTPTTTVSKTITDKSSEVKCGCPTLEPTPTPVYATIFGESETASVEASTGTATKKQTAETTPPAHESGKPEGEEENERGGVRLAWVPGVGLCLLVGAAVANGV